MDLLGLPIELICSFPGSGLKSASLSSSQAADFLSIFLLLSILGASSIKYKDV